VLDSLGMQSQASEVPLRARVALVTGVSRRAGIGRAVADHLVGLGATVVATGWRPHDAEMPWGADEAREDDEAAIGLEFRQDDLEDPAAPAAVVDDVVARHGALDIVVAAHARSSEQPLATVRADELDRCWAANVRSIVLLAQRFADRHDPARPGGRMLWFTSGQHLAPMGGEIAYAVTKGALHQLTRSVADVLIERGIVANCINPGPVDTGWATAEVRDAVAAMFPSGQWTTPAEIAALVGLLLRDEAAGIQGQVVDAESGFRRWAPVQ
jgi:3-oxoacyl-[acyl-carrier protein] reductase